MTSRMDQRPSEPRHVGRRAVTRGAAWSIPVVSLAIAAPAMAASGCKMTTGQLSWTGFANAQQPDRQGARHPGGTGVTVTVTMTGATGADNNGLIWSTTRPVVWPRCCASSTSTTSRTRSRPSRSPSASRSRTSRSRCSTSTRPSRATTEAYEDLVIVNTPGWTATKHSNVIGSGTAAAPYRAEEQQQPGRRQQLRLQRRHELGRPDLLGELHLQAGRLGQRKPLHRDLRHRLPVLPLTIADGVGRIVRSAGPVRLSVSRW